MLIAPPLLHKAFGQPDDFVRLLIQRESFSSSNDKRGVMASPEIPILTNGHWQ
jgi:hypothetical protein